MPEVQIDPDENATILYTSGTTGTPKGAVSSHRAILSALLGFSARAQVAELVEPQKNDSDKSPRNSFMLCVPLFHVTGLIPVMLGSFVGQSKLVMMHKWDPDRALELIENEDVTHFIGVPTMSWDLLEAETFNSRDTSSLRSVVNHGSQGLRGFAESLKPTFVTYKENPLVMQSWDDIDMSNGGIE